ncbi:PSD1 and planctomycete cytochrome C domain-containing protein [Thalassoroseus pseudoceratinae]|uniref:PSD1 and planctomycete cytochrome C domain-containing protein n=1 Tax=Thalassoroseus pseudoceratinae TaxID=2713176 RepID=UPI00141DB3FE|nr:PSD1 and planctomycete cytochrome C domain-containing protein [Thalassoroseus pseudoceratinae]
MTIRHSLKSILQGVCYVLILSGGSSAFLGNCFASDDSQFYTDEVKPLLRERCYACHGALKQEADLRLDTGDFIRRGGDSGSAIDLTSVESSLILDRISDPDPALRMPPEFEGEPLSAKQIEIIRQWIANGANAPADEKPEDDPKDHWAFQPIVRPKTPVANSDWIQNPIDAFVAAGHQKHGLTPQPKADRLVLLRRLYLDLLGVPPTSAEIAAFEEDTSAEWYTKVVDQLLDDPRHGERWGRHWMDIWRYSDWWGLNKQLRNSQKHIWHWRDWIVESLNEDMPYDEMVRLMLAADELHPTDSDKLRATGYLARNFYLFNRAPWMEETVEHVSKGFLGITLNCARCHDHKFDPFDQEDFYRMRAFFEPYLVRQDLVPGETDFSRDGIPRVYDALLDKPTYLYIRGDERTPDKSTKIEPNVPTVLAFDELIVEPVSLPPEAWQPERRDGVLNSYIADATRQFEAAEEKLLKLRATQEISVTEETNVSQAESESAKTELELCELEFAVAKVALESVERRVKAVKASWDDADSESAHEAIRGERQLAVAKAQLELAKAQQKLTNAKDDQKSNAKKSVTAAEKVLAEAQTKLNKPISESETFTPFSGAKWSATRFLSSGKDDPPPSTPSTSTGRRTALANWITDRRNPLTARVAVNHIWTRHFGKPLVPTVFDFGRKGLPPTHPELLDWLAVELMESGWSMKHIHRLIVTSSTYRMSSTKIGAETNIEIDAENRFLWRRIPIRLESQAVRDSLLALAGTLDLSMGGPPIPSAAQAKSNRRSLYFFHSNNERNQFLTTFDEALVKDCYRREQSIIPQQALALTNSELVLDASKQIATRLSNTHKADENFIREAFRQLLGMNPNAEEIAASQQAISAWKSLEGKTNLDARVNLIWVLVNHNDFVTLR